MIVESRARSSSASRFEAAAATGPLACLCASLARWSGSTITLLHHYILISSCCLGSDTSERARARDQIRFQPSLLIHSELRVNFFRLGFLLHFRSLIIQIQGRRTTKRPSNMRRGNSGSGFGAQLAPHFVILSCWLLFVCELV